MNQHTETYTFFITAFSLAVVELLDYKRQRRLEVQSISALFEMEQLYTESTPKSTQRPPSPWMRLCSSYVVCVHGRVCACLCVLACVCSAWGFARTRVLREEGASCGRPASSGPAAGALKPKT